MEYAQGEMREKWNILFGSEKMEEEEEGIS